MVHKWKDKWGRRDGVGRTVAFLARQRLKIEYGMKPESLIPDDPMLAGPERSVSSEFYFISRAIHPLIIYCFIPKQVWEGGGAYPRGSHTE